MNGYLTFLRSLTPYQQKAEIGRLAFIGGVLGPSLAEDILEDQAVIAFSEMLEVDPRSWKFDLKHYAEEPDLFGAPVFRDNQCTAPFYFRYLHSNHNLVVMGIIYIDDDESSMIGTLTCSTDGEKSRSRDRLVLAGIDPDGGRKVVSHDVEISRKIPYLDYLKRLMPQQRRDAIFDLTNLARATDNPKFLGHPKLAYELQKLGISNLRETEPVHEVGPVEFNGGRCTAPLTYYLYGKGELSKYDERSLGYYVEVHILAAIGNKPSGGGDISIQNMWFRIDSIDDPQDDGIPLLVP